MKVVVDFATYGSLIEFVPFLGDDIKLYQEEFEKWYYDFDQNGRIIGQRSDLQYEYFDVYVVIDWIKEVAPEANPVLLEETINFADIDRTLPAMCF